MSAVFFFSSSQAFIMVMIYMCTLQAYDIHTFFMNMYLTIKEFLKTHLIHVPYFKSLCINFGYMPHTELYDKQCQF